MTQVLARVQVKEAKILSQEDVKGFTDSIATKVTGQRDLMTMTVEGG